MNRLMPWLRLVSVPGIGPRTIKRLIEALGAPEAVFCAPPEQLAHVAGVDHRHACALATHRLPPEAHRELDRLAASPFRLVVYTDAEYPPLLRHIPDPPPLLYVYGRLPHPMDGIAVVGSRAATDYGRQVAHQLAGDLARWGLAIISGMADGIDGSAHHGALDAGGHTVAVLGCGVDRIYPSRHRRLYHRIAQTGAVVSELPLGSAPLAYHFPARNRIISGMSRGTLVVEASRQSGSLITAALAAEQNREVFAVPGNVRSFKSTGTHTLIKQGAKLVENAQDIIDELQGIRSDTPEALQAPPPTAPPLSPTAEDVLAAFPSDAVLMDDLARTTGLPIAHLSNALLELELAGRVMACPGNRYIRQ